MSTRALIENDLMDLLFKRVEKFVKKGHIKSTVGFNFIDGYLIIDIGNEKTIHINPAKKIIKLVDTLTGSVEDLSYYELTTVQWFFKSVDEKMTNISRVEGNDSFQRLIDFFYKIDSKELFFSTELSYYKSLFSGHLTTFCLGVLF